jgi:large repetitive protein
VKTPFWARGFDADGTRAFANTPYVVLTRTVLCVSFPLAHPAHKEKAMAMTHNSTNLLFSRPRRFDLALVLLWMLGLFAIPRSNAQALTFPGQTPVGSISSSLAINVLVQKTGTLVSIDVLSQGNGALDFQTAGPGSCVVGISYFGGQTCSVNVNFQPKFPGLRTGAVVLAAGDGSSLGTALISGIGMGAIAIFIPGEIATKAGHASWLYSGDGGPATNASIFLPFGIALDSLGNLYIADSGNNRIRVVKATTGVISTIAGSGSLGATGDGGPAIQAALSGPTSVAVDGAGNIFVCDSGNNVVREIAHDSGIITTIAGRLGQTGFSGDGSQATAATLNSPNGIALDAFGNLFIADTANNVVRRVDALSGMISTVSGTGTAGFNGDNISAKTARLNAPWSIASDSSGNLYIADQGNHRIRKVNGAGLITTIAGTGVGGFTGDGGAASLAMLNAPAAVVIDPAADIYIADSGNNRIRKVNGLTGVITTVAGTTTQSISGDGGPATAAGLYGPYTLALDGPGNLYIADVFHHRVRVVSSAQAVLNYQPLRIGRVAAAQQQIVENDGNAPLNVSLVQTISDSVLDSLTTTCLNSTVLAQLQSCSIGASFAPTTLGNPLIGVISFASNAVNNPATLKLSGNVLGQDPSTVLLQASANPVQTGDSVYFTVTVSSSGVIPTGQATLLDGTNQIGTINLQAGGVATFNVSNLSGGQHSITASYAGDNNNTAAVSAPLIETVTFVAAPTQTILIANINPVLAGQPVVLTATVSLTNPGSTKGPITGPVTFTDGNTIIGAGSVTGGMASITLSTLAIGKHSIIASYSGLSAFAASTSAPLLLTVQPGTTNTVLTPSANPTPAGGSLVLNASVTSNNIMPTGIVTFLDGTTPLGSAAVNQTGLAALQVAPTALSVGTHSITALYSGDLLNDGSFSGVLTETVALAVTTSTATSSLNPAPQGAPVTISATVTSSGGTPGGTVQFFDGSFILGTGTLDANGVATLATALLGLGTHSITVRYGGDPLDDISTSPTLSQVIVPATTTVTLSAAANPAVAGSPLVLMVVVQGTGSQPTGSITLQDGATTLGVQPIDSAGSATFTIASLAIGVHNLLALYSGDADHAPNNASAVERIVQATTTTLTSSAPTAFAGTRVTFAALVVGLNGQPLTGAVQLKDGAVVVATIPMATDGSAVFNSSTLSIGSHSLSAIYSGDTLDQVSSSIPLLQTVQIAPTSTTLATSGNPSFAGSKLDLTASVTGSGAPPTGLVTFLDSGAVIGVIRVDGSGSATLSSKTLSPGTHNLTASYPGDANNRPSGSNAVSQSIVQQTILTIYSSANPAVFQSDVTITVTVSGGLPAYPPTGSVSLFDGGILVGSGPINALATFHFTLHAPSLGQHTLTASYSGDANNNPSTSPAFNQNVTLTQTTVDFVSTASSLSAGDMVTFSAVVQGAGPKFPSGVVTFQSGATVLGSATLDASGLATLTFVPPQGNYNVVAQYPGDTLFARSNSASISVLVGPTVEFTMNATPSTISMQSGDHTTIQIDIVTASTFGDTLAIGCAGLPAFATCTFSNNNIHVIGGGKSTLSLVLDTGTPLGAGPTASLYSAPSSATTLCILPGGILLTMLLLRPRRFRKHLSAFTMILTLCAMGALSGCSNSFNVNDTPAGAYTIEIIGRGIASGHTQSGTILLKVTK